MSLAHHLILPIIKHKAGSYRSRENDKRMKGLGGEIMRDPACQASWASDGHSHRCRYLLLRSVWEIFARAKHLVAKVKTGPGTVSRRVFDRSFSFRLTALLIQDKRKQERLGRSRRFISPTITMRYNPTRSPRLPCPSAIWANVGKRSCVNIEPSLPRLLDPVKSSAELLPSRMWRKLRGR